MLQISAIPDAKQQSLPRSRALLLETQLNATELFILLKNLLART
jgi:hypothetical protein